jgi:GT2 family glycosyltransferase
VVLERVGVVVVAYASEGTLPATLEALPREELGGLVVVDNASPDASAEVARRFGATVVAAENRGFGAGNNAGNARLTTELALFLNPDAVLSRSDLVALVAYLDAHPRCAVVGPLVRSAGRPSYAAGRLDSLATELRPLLPAPLSVLGPRRRFPPDYARSGPVGYVEGACFLVRRDVLAEVGGFDERYFLYFEELDLARRLRAIGAEVHLCADAVVEHAMGTATATVEHGGSTHLVRSTVRYLRRWHGERQARLWAAAARTSWRLRARTGRLDAPRAAAWEEALADELSHGGAPGAAQPR